MGLPNGRYVPPFSALGRSALTFAFATVRSKGLHITRPLQIYNHWIYTQPESLRETYRYEARNFSIIG